MTKSKVSIRMQDATEIEPEKYSTNNWSWEFILLCSIFYEQNSLKLMIQREIHNRKTLIHWLNTIGDILISNTVIYIYMYIYIFSSVHSLSCVWLFAIPWTTAHQASLFITSSQSSPKPMSSELVMPSSHLILCFSPSLPAFNLSQHQGLFKWVSSSHQVAKVMEPQLHQSCQWTPRTDLL